MIEEKLLDTVPYDQKSKSDNIVTEVDGKEVPPDGEKWTFNENDILGNVITDQGDVVIHKNEDNGEYQDIDGNPVN